MTRTAAGWLFLALGACTSAGCASLPPPAPILDPGPSADPNADPGQECLRRIHPGMPIEQARQIIAEVAPNAEPVPLTSNIDCVGGIVRNYAVWRLNQDRTFTITHDLNSVVKVNLSGR